MADTTPLEQLSDWVAADDDLALDEQGRIVVSDEIRIDVDIDDDRLLLTHTSLEPGAGDERVAELRSLLPGRATTMRGTVEPGDTGASVTITNKVYIDGLNHQTFSTALRDLVGAVDTIGVAAAAAQSTAEDEPAEPVDPQPAGEPQPAPTQTAAPEAPHAPEPTRETPPAWAATHAVPAGGMSAWSEPNPELPAAANLEARVRLSIAERRGDWAKVVGSNGWTGWVDARRLVALDTAPGEPRSGFALGSRSLNPIILVGALLTAVSALLPWFDNGQISFNAMDLSGKILFDYEGTGSPYLGWIIFALAALTLAAAFMTRPTAPAVVLGIATIAVAVLFLAQIYRFVTDVGGSFGDLTEVIGFAPAVTFGGGIVILVGGNR